MPTHQGGPMLHAMLINPGDIPDRGWLDVLIRPARSLGRDSMWLRSGGVALCAIFAAIPGASATAALFGLLAYPEAVHRPVEMLDGPIPGSANTFLADQMQAGTLTFRAQIGAGQPLVPHNTWFCINVFP